MDGGEWSSFTSMDRGPGTDGIRGWLSPSGSLNVMRNRKISCPCLESNPESSVLAYLLYRPSYMGSCPGIKFQQAGIPNKTLLPSLGKTGYACCQHNSVINSTGTRVQASTKPGRQKHKETIQLHANFTSCTKRGDVLNCVSLRRAEYSVSATVANCIRLPLSECVLAKHY
jgi:hypothetical protein